MRIIWKFDFDAMHDLTLLVMHNLSGNLQLLCSYVICMHSQARPPLDAVASV